MDELRVDETAESIRILHTKAYKNRSHTSKRKICVAFLEETSEQWRV